MSMEKAVRWRKPNTIEVCFPKQKSSVLITTHRPRGRPERNFHSFSLSSGSTATTSCSLRTALVRLFYVLAERYADRPSTLHLPRGGYGEADRQHDNLGKRNRAGACRESEIPTRFGETLSWLYLCYVREHPSCGRFPPVFCMASMTI